MTTQSLRDTPEHTERVTPVPFLCLDPCMALQKRGKGGRPGKGERHVVTARVPVAHAEELFSRADALGVSLSEYLAGVIARELQQPPTAPAVQQEAMKISA